MADPVFLAHAVDHKNLVDMAAQALVTSSVMQTIMGVVGVGTSVVTGAAGAGSGRRSRMPPVTSSSTPKAAFTTRRR